MVSYLSCPQDAVKKHKLFTQVKQTATLLGALRRKACGKFYSLAFVGRDMKLDNTLFDGQHPPFIKICDFGFARAWQDTALYRMSSRVG